ncbi:hypothetical protein [Franzmannia qiaohouensis]|uniref:Uncharacterized protein n=1 Tax=Franzmannia qiaohouensis TaxID=1329370 RepID=A0ABU1HLK9_9GAMM|nr:hypothetical protein [Halomonas qiaohouensis]MDR5907634.1 hypothetical protein [Halomonas qiaohouensis]
MSFLLQVDAVDVQCGGLAEVVEGGIEPGVAGRASEGLEPFAGGLLAAALKRQVNGFSLWHVASLALTQCNTY